MDKEKSIEYIIESIRVIEKQIKFFENNKPLFCNRNKIRKYNDRIEMLENSKEYLYRMLEYKIDK